MSLPSMQNLNPQNLFNMGEPPCLARNWIETKAAKTLHEVIEKGAGFLHGVAIPENPNLVRQTILERCLLSKENIAQFPMSQTNSLEAKRRQWFVEHLSKCYGDSASSQPAKLNAYPVPLSETTIHQLEKAPTASLLVFNKHCPFSYLLSEAFTCVAESLGPTRAFVAPINTIQEIVQTDKVKKCPNAPEIQTYPKFFRVQFGHLEEISEGDAQKIWKKCHLTPQVQDTSTTETVRSDMLYQAPVEGSGLSPEAVANQEYQQARIINNILQAVPAERPSCGRRPYPFGQYGQW